MRLLFGCRGRRRCRWTLRPDCCWSTAGSASDANSTARIMLLDTDGTVQAKSVISVLPSMHRRCPAPVRQ